MAFAPFLLLPPRPQNDDGNLQDHRQLPSQLDAEVRNTFGDAVADNPRLSSMGRNFLNALPYVYPPRNLSGSGAPQEEYAQLEIKGENYVTKSELDIAIREQGSAFTMGKRFCLWMLRRGCRHTLFTTRMRRQGNDFLLNIKRRAFHREMMSRSII